MRIKSWLILMLVIISLASTACGQRAQQANEPMPQKERASITISAAASLKEPMEEIAQNYRTINPNVELALNFASSGVLQQQIEQGAPVDIFISAASKQMNALEDKGLLLEGTRKDLLRNTLVLVVPSQSSVTGFADLAGERVKKIAIGAPESVPAGKYAQEVFAHLGLTDQIASKLVMAKDVREVLAYVETGNVDAGMVYQTDATISRKVKIAATAPEDSHTPIQYPVAVIKDSKNQVAAKEFIQYLTSPAAKSIFIKYGFKTLE
ncbi:MAG: molybdate ABC transporter substrate-binding protein [Syntrophomonadaceae bacterium]|nr:molybdate ABC transporter substrate-binding protein [Syntrophomonadaceae bacterium]